MAEDNRTGMDNPYKVPEAVLSSSDVYAPEGKMYTQGMIEHLKNTKPWVRFIAVLGFFGAGAMILGGIGMAVASGALDSTLSYTMIGLAFVYFVFGGIYLIPLIFLNRYASSINELLQTGETRSMEEALRHQKSFWKFMGIATIAGIGLGILIVIAVIVAGVFRYLQ